MSFSIVIRNIQKAELFVNMFQHVKVFSPSINIMFETERMFVQSMDSSRVSVFEITIPAEWFDNYEVQRSVNLGINVAMLSSVLCTRDKSQQIELVYNEDDDKLYLHFTRQDVTVSELCATAASLSAAAAIEDEDDTPPAAASAKKPAKKARGKKAAEITPDDDETVVTLPTAPSQYIDFDRHFELQLIDLENEIMSIPDDIDYQAEFSISAIKFANLIGQLKLFGDTLNIKCSEEKIILAAVSTESGKMEVFISISDLSEYAIEENQIVNLSFSLRLLQNICLYAKLSREIKIYILKGFPLRVDYNLIDGATLVFYLAPKIGEDDEEDE